MKALTITEAKAQGFTVDITCYPHIGYKGDRFAPTEMVKVFTEIESALLDALPSLLRLAAMACHQGDPDIKRLQEIASYIEEVLGA